MLRENIYTDVEKATVILLGKHGQGVLVSSNLIITAAHCIDYKRERDLVLRDYIIEEIQTKEDVLKVTLLAIEPVSDIAILGSLDYQEFGKESEKFDKFCERTKPVLLSRKDDLDKFQEFRVHIFTHKRTWVLGKASISSKDSHELWVEADELIEGGTSGGPIIDDMGELVGICSNASTPTDPQHKSDGTSPRPHLALPVWVCRRIFRVENENQKPIS